MNPDLLLTLKLAMPVLWLIVSTGVALLLYRTSEALFEQERRDKTETRRVRMVGSGAIAVFAFVGLMYATSLDKIGVAPKGSVLLDAKAIADLKARMMRADQVVADLDACVAVSGAAGECRSEMAMLKSRLGDLNETVQLLN